MGRLAFQHPWFLYLSALAALPLLIHLLGRKKPAIVVFPPFELVARLEKRTRSRRRISSILLLLARTLLLLLLPAAFAGPYFRSEAAPGGHSLDVVVLDSSMSTLQMSGGSTVFSSLKSRAMEIASRASESRRFLLAAAGRPVRLVTPEPVFSPERAQEAVGAVKAGFGGTSVRDAVELARAVIESTGPGEVRLHILSDMAAHAIGSAGELRLPSGGGAARIVLYDGGASPGPNLALVSAQARAARGSVKVTAVVLNPQAAAARTEVTATLFGGGEGSSSIEAPAGAEATAVIGIPSESGAAYGKVEIPADALREDNTAYFAWTGGGAVRVLLADCDRRTARHLDESFYLEKALSVDTGGLFEVDTAGIEAVRADAAGRYNVIALLNCPAVAPAALGVLETFVSGGGGLFVTAGPLFDPGGLGDSGILPARVSAAADARATEIVLEGGRLLPEIQRDERFALHAVVRKLTPLAPAPGASVVASAPGAGPLLVISARGGGKVAILGTTADREWTDWPIRTSYLPVMRSLFGILSGRGGRTPVADVVSGIPSTVDIPACPAVLKDRGGEETAVRCEAGAQGASAAIPAGIAPGIYALLSGGEKVADVVARTDPAESDLKKLSSEEIRAIAASGGEARGLSWGAPENRQGGVAPAAAIIIVFAVLCLAFEMWMTRKR